MPDAAPGSLHLVQSGGVRGRGRGSGPADLAQSRAVSWNASDARAAIAPDSSRTSAPAGHSRPAQLAKLMTAVTHATFISGMNAAFGVASVVALASAAIALLTKRRHAVEGGAVI
jgi:hypothetical protein